MPTRNFPVDSKTIKHTSSARRRLLQLSVTLPISLPVFTASVSLGTRVSYHLVKNQESAAGVIEGAVVTGRQRASMSSKVMASISIPTGGSR